MNADGETLAPEGEQPGPPIQPKAHVPPVTAIRAAPPKPKRLSRKTLMAASLLLSCVVAFALVNGLSERERSAASSEDSQPVQPASPPESVRIAQAEYSADDLRPPIEEEGRDFFWGDYRPDGEAGSRAFAARTGGGCGAHLGHPLRRCPMAARPATGRKRRVASWPRRKLYRQPARP
jgi:hypothetical protein